MGSSGCGKTTLLNVLSGKLETNRISTQGEILFNEKPISSINYENIVSYVIQHDLIEAYMTPLEILLFYARMKLTLSPQEIELKVHKIISDLHLFKCRNSLIGDHIHRGISGNYSLI
jgi:ABC-type multidrug transport system ATPase subunit